MFRKFFISSLTLATAAITGATVANAACSCAPGQTRSLAAAAHAYVVLPQNTKKSISKEDIQSYHSPACWAVTQFSVEEKGLGTMGAVSWSAFPAGVNFVSNSSFENAHQQALDALIEVGYKGEELASAQAAINESYSNMQNEFNELISSHGGVEIVARVSGRGRLTWKGRESAEATLRVTETCVPGEFSSEGGVKSLITQNANLTPPTPTVGGGGVIGTVGTVDRKAVMRPAVRSLAKPLATQEMISK